MSKKAIREKKKKKPRRCKRCKKVKKLVGGGLCETCAVMRDLAGA